MKRIFMRYVIVFFLGLPLLLNAFFITRDGKPAAEIVVFPQQDVVTTSNGVELPDDEW
jgi:hypothetical protein